MAIKVRSMAFGDGQPIPPRYAQEGANVSPPLDIGDVPNGTRELLLIADDPDAATPDPWVHWLMYKIPSGTHHVPEGVRPGPQLHRPTGALQGRTTAGRMGYDGPAPPRGSGAHHYRFHVFALDAEVRLPAGADKRSVLKRVQDHVLDEGELIGTYER